MKIWSKNFLLLVLFFLALVMSGFFVWSRFFCSTCGADKGISSSQILNFTPQADSQAPDFILRDLNNKIVSLADFEGKNVLLVFWATYCGWCAKEKEDLMRFTNEQKGKIEVVAIVEESRQAVIDYISQEKINFIILIDENGAAFDKYRVLGTPSHFLINSEREIVVGRPGYVSYNDLLMLAQSLEK